MAKAKMSKEKILKLGTIEAMVLCNQLGLPEGSGEEMRQALLEHFGYAKSTKPSED